VSEEQSGAEAISKAALGADLIIPALATAFTVYFLVTSADLVWEARANGTVIGVVLLALIAVQLFRIATLRAQGQGTLSLGEFGQLSALHWQRLAILLILSLFVATIPWVGTTLGLLLIMLTLMYVLGVRNWKTLLWVSSATAAAVYLAFIVFLKTQLPFGPIERLLQPLFG
jgi:hypothetical protein